MAGNTRAKFERGIRAQKDQTKNRVRNPDGSVRYEYQLCNASGGLTPRMKLMADLATLGMTQRAVHQYTKTKAFVRPNSAHSSVGQMQKDLRVLERTNSEIETMVAEAKKIIQKASTKAAQNYSDAVDDGDLKASGKVLDLCGAFASQSDVNVRVAFGSWLKESQNTRGEIDITPRSDNPSVARSSDSNGLDDPSEPLALEEPIMQELVVEPIASQEDLGEPVALGVDMAHGSDRSVTYWNKRDSNRPASSKDGFGHLDNLVDKFAPGATQHPEDPRITSGKAVRIAMNSPE